VRCPTILRRAARDHVLHSLLSPLTLVTLYSLYSVVQPPQLHNRSRNQRQQLQSRIKMKPPETYTEFTSMRKKVCSKFLAKICIFNNDCDGGTHPAELDPTKKPEEPNPVSTEKSINSSFVCERCIDKGIKSCASPCISEFDADCCSAISWLVIPRAKNPARSNASSQARTTILVTFGALSFLMVIITLPCLPRDGDQISAR
jgi:hypothetical protein